MAKPRPGDARKPHHIPQTVAANAAVLPLGAMMLAASVLGWAQTTPPEKTLSSVTVKKKTKAKTPSALPARASAKASKRCATSAVHHRRHRKTDG